MAATSAILLPHDGPEGLSRWLAAAAVVLALHAGAVGAHLLWPSTEPDGAPDAPAVLIDLAPIAAAPTSQMDVAPGPEAIDSQATPQPKVEQERAPEPVVEVPPAEKPLVALQAEPPKPEVKPEEPKPVSKPEPQPEQAAPSSQQAAPPKTERVAVMPVAPRIGARAQNSIPPSWVAQLMAHLNRHKQYPGAARAKREQGVVTVKFTMDRNGHVLSREVAKSSGSAALDGEALAMLLRSQPLPHFSADMAGETRSFNAPIRFSLQ